MSRLKRNHTLEPALIPPNNVDTLARPLSANNRACPVHGPRGLPDRI
jgi:hypothetical protein